MQTVGTVMTNLASQTYMTRGKSGGMPSNRDDLVLSVTCYFKSRCLTNEFDVKINSELCRDTRHFFGKMLCHK
jgi:hypothetical protein